MHTEKGVSVAVDALSVQTEVSSPSAAENRLQITSSNMEDGGPGLGRLTSTGLQLPTWAPVMVRYLKRCVKNGVIQQITQGLHLKSANNKCVNSGEMEWKAVIKLDSRGYGSRSTVIERKVQILGGKKCAAVPPGFLELLSLFPQCIWLFALSCYLDVFTSKHIRCERAARW